MTFAEIRADICRRLDKNAINLDPETKTRLDTFINDRYRELLRLDGINTRDETYQIPTVAGGSRYVLPPGITQVINIVNMITGRPLVQTSLQWIRWRWTSLAPAIGSPTHYAILNNSMVLNQPTNYAAGALQILSTVTQSLVPLNIEYEAPPPGGHMIFTSAAISSTVPVVVNVPVFVVYRMQMSQPATGIVTLSQVNPPLTICQITPNTAMPRTSSHGWTLLLWPTPSAAIPLLVDATHARRQLSLDGDEPDLPEEFHTALVWGGCSEECLKMDDDRVKYYEGKYQDDVRRLRAFLHQSRGQRWVPRQRNRGWSDLGGRFPADRW